MFKKLLLATAVIGALTISATAARPQFAQADSSCFLGTPLCHYSFGVGHVTCPLGTVDVSATADSHDYRYEVECSNSYQG